MLICYILIYLLKCAKGFWLVTQFLSFNAYHLPNYCYIYFVFLYFFSFTYSLVYLFYIDFLWERDSDKTFFSLRLSWFQETTRKKSKCIPWQNPNSWVEFTKRYDYHCFYYVLTCPVSHNFGKTIMIIQLDFERENINQFEEFCCCFPSLITPDFYRLLYFRRKRD